MKCEANSIEATAAKIMASLGTVGFALAMVSLVVNGFAPASLVLSGIGFTYRKSGLAIAGMIVSSVSLVGWGVLAVYLSA